MPKRKRANDEGYGRKRQFLGRVANRSKVKKVELLNLGAFVHKQGWYNAGYIFPNGYTANVEYKDIIDPNIKIPYLCEIIDNGGKPWFQVTSNTVNTTFAGKSPTACWKQILDCINETLRSRNQPVVKTQVAGPEYFGLNDPKIVEQIESLDPTKSCDVYWAEKENILKARELYENVHPKSDKKCRKRRKEDEEDVRLNEDDNKENYRGAWSAIQRNERYIQRCEKMGAEVLVESDNPLPEYQDPITLQPVIAPALSPYGHVAGYYSWTQALKETNGYC
eukprot:CAMPEP_0202951452 /NCGR_PEP_ID=MMETSP1395-20130829/31270_1 /ASSEMBLY_ACC=CAM_ASM_000871 /TAXON_ID=5961 /ORGANISM="Blepharisma japonicum, Strain Stock R1072" /LENGTH=278 /DNA_ID=CAMNT_0049658679 /DNA_START=293 /DNA_END=1126 /DNA_ORIENTATION=-